MGEAYVVVDQLKIEYQGVFSVKDLFAMFGKWYQESPYEKGGDYTSEYNTAARGKFIEHVYFPWKKETDYIRHYMKIRLVMAELKKVDIVVDGVKQRLDHGRVRVYIDGFIEQDYDARWQGKPIFIFIRTLYTKFFYKRYTKYFEKVIIDDCHALYERFERFFNMYKSYRKVKAVPYFS